MREIAKALRRHVDQKTLEQVINDLLDVPGNKSFRDRIETLAHELLKTSSTALILCPALRKPHVVARSWAEFYGRLAEHAPSRACSLSIKRGVSCVCEQFWASL